MPILENFGIDFLVLACQEDPKRDDYLESYHQHIGTFVYGPPGAHHIVSFEQDAVESAGLNKIEMLIVLDDNISRIEVSNKQKLVNVKGSQLMNLLSAGLNARQETGLQAWSCTACRAFVINKHAKAVDLDRRKDVMLSYSKFPRLCYGPMVGFGFACGASADARFWQGWSRRRGTDCPPCNFKRRSRHIPYFFHLKDPGSSWRLNLGI